MDEHKHCFFTRADSVCTVSYHEQPSKLQLPNKVRWLSGVIAYHSPSAFSSAGKVSEKSEDQSDLAIAMVLRAKTAFDAIDTDEGRSERKEVSDRVIQELRSYKTDGVSLVRREIGFYARFGKTYGGIQRVQAELAFARLVLLELEADNPGLLNHYGLGNPKYGLLSKVTGPRKKPAPRVIKVPFVPTSDWERPNLLVKAIFKDDFETEGNNSITASANASHA